MSKLIIISLFIRLFQILYVKTFYNADEYWQGPEIAFNLVFGYGYKYIFY